MSCDSPGDGSKSGDGTFHDVTNDISNPPEVIYPPSPIVVAFGQTPISQGDEVQLDASVTSRVIRVVAADTTPVTVKGIGWARGNSGLPENNPHVRLMPVTVPVTLSTPQAEMTFTVRLASDVSDIDDSTPSTLLITSEFTDALGVVKTHDFPLVIAISRNSSPTLLTSSMTFLHRPGQLQTDQTRLYQQFFGGWFYVTSYELESPSNEIVLSSESSPPMRIGPTADDYLDVRVSFTPQSETLVSNAILFYLDSQDTPLRLPIQSVTPFEAYELTYSDSSQFDFRGITTTTTRSAALTNVGTVQLLLNQPRLTPAAAAAAFQIRYFVVGIEGGSDVEISSWPRGLQAGRSLRIDITHTPTAGSPDGQLELFYAGADPRLIAIPISLISAKP